METDYRTIHSDLGASGSYFGTNKVFGGTVSLLPSDTRVQSGVIHSIALMVSGSSFSGSVDFVFSSALPAPGTVGAAYSVTFTELKSVISSVSLLPSEFVFFGGHANAALNSLNIPFNSDSVYLTSVYQNTNSASFNSGSVWVTVGYELGSSRG